MRTVIWTEEKIHTGKAYLRTVFNFGVKDAKGREVGSCLLVTPADSIRTYSPDLDASGERPFTERFAITCQLYAVRDGHPFGGSQSKLVEHETVEAAKADAIARAEANQKKAERKAAKNGGVYK